MTYKDALTSAMDLLAKDERARFIGYGLTRGAAMGTMKNVPMAQRIETTVAENLMVGMATGLALKGYKPLVFLERCDFILNAMDAIVNHLDKIEAMSRGEFSPGVILRVIVGNKMKPLFTGITHTQDFHRELASMVAFPVSVLTDADGIMPTYEEAIAALPNRSTAIFEYKDLL